MSPLIGKEEEDADRRALGPKTGRKLDLSLDFHEQLSGGGQNQVYAIDHPSTRVGAGPVTWPLTDRKCDGMPHM